MYSMSSSDEIGSADKGCSYTEIIAFELRIFGEVDEAALKSFWVLIIGNYIHKCTNYLALLLPLPDNKTCFTKSSNHFGGFLLIGLPNLGLVCFCLSAIFSLRILMIDKVLHLDFPFDK